MGKGAVIYGSKYGHTARYAKHIAGALGFDLLEGRKTDPNVLSQYPVVVYGGGLYAGGIKGISLISKNFSRLGKNRIVLFTVGLADPTIPEQFEDILRRNLSPEMRANIRVFHLRGGIDYAALGPVHGAMMKIMYSQIRSKPPQSRTEEDKAFLESYGAKVDFTDFATAAPLIEYVQSLL